MPKNVLTLGYRFNMEGKRYQVVPGLKDIVSVHWNECVALLCEDFWEKLHGRLGSLKV